MLVIVDEENALLPLWLWPLAAVVAVPRRWRLWCRAAGMGGGGERQMLLLSRLERGGNVKLTGGGDLRRVEW